MTLSITAIVLAKNSEKTIFKSLESLRDFAEVVLVDTGSTDQTLNLAKKFANVKIQQEKFSNFGTLRNLASSYATFDWLFVLDSDEVLTPDALRALKESILEKECVYSFSRKNFFNEKFIRWCGWYPDRVMRLYHRKATSYSSDFVHEKILINNLREVKLKADLEHYSYHKISDFLEKMEKYTTLFAEMNKYKKSSSPLKALLHGLYAFIKSFILQRGFLSGWEGLIISLYNSQTSFYKYLKLWEANKDAFYD